MPRLDRLPQISRNNLLTFPANEASAPLGMRIATDGMCSNESGIDSNKMFIGYSSYARPSSPIARATVSR